MTKKKLLIILGAGSSISCGMPSVSQIDTKMKEWSKAWEHPPTYIKGSIGDGIFNEVWQILENYYNSISTTHLRISVNFEKVLAEMLAIASWTSPAPFGMALSKMVRNKDMTGILTLPNTGSEDYAQRHFVVEQFEYLLDKLANYMRYEASFLNEETQAFKDYKDIITQLRAEFEVGIYNLNYDNVAVRVWPDAFNGFSGGEFDAKSVAQRTEWNFIYHIHGSVHNSILDPMTQKTIWKDNLQDGFLNFTPADTTTDFKHILTTTLIAGGNKLGQLLADPFQSFYSSLARHVHEADAVLLGGYGFGDEHVNRALKNRFRHELNAHNRPPCVVLTKSNEDDTIVGLRHDILQYHLNHTVNTRFKDHLPLPFDMKASKGRFFEPDFFNRVLVWHGGFVEAKSYTTDIIKHLSQI